MTYARTAALGVAASGLAAWAGTKDWIRLAVDFKTGGLGVGPDVSADQPLALALGLVLLACWGVILVARGRLRSAVAWLGLLGVIGYVACVASAPFTLPTALRTGQGLDDVSAVPTTWYFVAALAGLVLLAIHMLAVRRVSTWPEMGSKYDAPGAVIRDERDLWRAFDEGHDPTL